MSGAPAGESEECNTDGKEVDDKEGKGGKEGGAKKIRFTALPALEAAMLSYDMLSSEQRPEALEKSIAKGDSALVRAAHQRGFPLDEPINEYGQTMVHVAAMCGQAKVRQPTVSRCGLPAMAPGGRPGCGAAAWHGTVWPPCQCAVCASLSWRA